MEAKYYTPSIEEFHVGFEYEYFIMDGWQPVAYHPSDIAEADEFFKQLYSNKIRVKYIDKEDCVNLGLKLKIWSFGSGYFEKGDFIIGINATGNFCTISQNDNGNKIMRFSGNLKNKSELAKIMQQLEIK